MNNVCDFNLMYYALVTVDKKWLPIKQGSSVPMVVMDN